jgi:hypothetical protein
VTSPTRAAAPIVTKLIAVRTFMPTTLGARWTLRIRASTEYPISGCLDGPWSFGDSLMSGQGLAWPGQGCLVDPCRHSGAASPCQNPHMATATAAAYADESVARVGGDPKARLAFLRQLYKVPADVDRGYLPYRRAASAFMGWQLRRGLLNPESDPTPGSPWWRAVNDSLLRDTCEASAIAFGRPGDPRTASVAATLEFVDAEHSLGHLLDVGIIVPRLPELYGWSARELALPGITALLDRQGPTPAYAWDPSCPEVWHPEPSLFARAARRALPVSRRPGRTR